MSLRDVFLLTIDGLRASALGSYGNTWYPTPAFDRFASQATLFEWLFADQPDASPAPRFDRAGTPAGDAGRGGGLLQAVLDVGGQVCVATDDPHWHRRCTDLRRAASLFTPPSTSVAAAATTLETGWASWFADVVGLLAEWQAPEFRTEGKPRLFWAHTAALWGPWDAPAAWRAALCDEEDPPPPDWLAPPRSGDLGDPDALFACRIAYAAQCQVLDACFESLLHELDQYDGDRAPVVAVAGLRGWPLGEHGAVGAEGAGLYGEWLHVPCLMRLPQHEPSRCDALAHVGDLAQTIAALLGLPAEPRRGQCLLSASEAPEPADSRYLIARNDRGEAAVRTRDWSLVGVRPTDRPENAGPGRLVPRLFVKPDDRWECNEVADRCPEAVAVLLPLAEQAAGEPEGPGAGSLSEAVRQRPARR